MSMGQPPKPEGASTVFVFGLLGLVVCAPLGIVAWIQGNEYLSRCQAMGVEPEGIGVAGRILGIIGTALTILSVVGAVLMFLLLFGMAAVG